MSKCLNCGEETPPNLRNSNPRKYCSKKCANRFHSKKNSIRRPGWGDATKREQEAREARKTAYNKAIADGWIDYRDVAPTLGITHSAVYVRIKNLLEEGTETAKLYNSERNVYSRFISPAGLEKLKQFDKVPEGLYRSSDVRKTLGLAESTFLYYRHKFNIQPSHKSRPGAENLYTQEEVDNFINLLESARAESEALKAQRSAESKRLKEKKRADRERARKERLEAVKKDYVTPTDAIPWFWFSTVQPIYSLIRKGILKTKKIEGVRGRWIHIEHLEEVSQKVKSEHLENLRQIEENKKNKDSWKRCEKTKWQRREAKNRSYTPDRATQSSVTSNQKYWHDHDNGTVTHLPCNKCKTDKPYYEFSISWTSTRPRGRETRCYSCVYETKSKQSRPRQKKRFTPEQKLRRVFGIAIKHQISKNRGVRATDMSMPKVWKALADKCGYDEQALVSHIESLFVSPMSWDSYGQLGTTIPRGNFCWVIDHIQPKNSFSFTSLEDPEFIECWSLSNLRPLETRLNIMKSDKKLRGSFNASFRKGLFSKGKKVSGIWQFLPYDRQAARDHIESKFVGEMSWDNFGTLWQIDHIKPQAALPYLTPECKNFSLCWSLDNLEPRLRAENNAKGSIYDGIKWIYDDI